VIPVIIGATGTISKSFRKYVSAIPETTKLTNYRKVPYGFWTLHTYLYFEKRLCKSTLEPTQKLVIWAPKTVATE
jgi:hypothetical protein